MSWYGQRLVWTTTGSLQTSYPVIQCSHARSDLYIAGHCGGTIVGIRNSLGWKIDLLGGSTTIHFPDFNSKGASLAALALAAKPHVSSNPTYHVVFGDHYHTHMGPLENDRQNVVTLRPPPPRALSNSIWRGDHQVDVSCKSGQIESTAIHHLNSPRSPRWLWQKIGVGCWSVSSLGPAVHWYAALEQEREEK